MAGYSFKNIVFFCLKIFFTFKSSVDPDEMPHNAVSRIHVKGLSPHGGGGGGVL